jgi:hypothetical protein
VECLVNAAGVWLDQGQDDIGLGSGAVSPADWFGNSVATNGNDPIGIQANSKPQRRNFVTTSSSIVTLPIYDDNGVVGYAAPVKIIGVYASLDSAVPASGSSNGEGQIYVLNISGCGPSVNPSLPSISGGGSSPVLELIHR